MNLPKMRKGSPLLLLVLLTIGAFAVGAVLFDLFISGPTTGIYQVDTDVRGLDAQLIQAGAWDLYNTPTDSATLELMMYGGLGADGPPATADHRVWPTGFEIINPLCIPSTSAILVINAHDLIDEDLVMTIEIFDAGTSTPYEGTWSCSPLFAEFYLSNINYRQIVGYKDNFEGEYFIPPTDNGDGTWTITYAQIVDMIYDPNVSTQQQTDPSGIGNSLILGFDFAVQPAVEYSDVGPVAENSITEIPVDVVVSLSVEDGMPE